MSRNLRIYLTSFIVAVVLLVSSCKTFVVTKEPEPKPTFTPLPTGLPTALPSASPILTKVSVPSAAWSFATGAAIWGTASVSGGTVYVGSDDGYLYALEAQTGALKWKFATQGIVRSQPFIAGGLVYVVSDDGFLYAADARAGAQTWRTDIGNSVAREVREKLTTDTNPTGWDYKQSSPIVADGVVYVGSLDGKIYALAADTGRIIWTFVTGGKVRATPVIVDGTIFIGSWDKCFYALDAATGELRWKTMVLGQVQSTALVANGLVYIASRKASVAALDIQTGKYTWEYSYGPNLWVESSPILVNGKLYIGSSGNKWIVGLDGQSGKEFTIFYSKAWHLSTPVVLGDMLYIGGTSFTGEASIGGLFGFRLVDGKFTGQDHAEWYFTISEKSLEAEGNWSGVFSSPVVAGSLIYIGGLDGVLYALDTTTWEGR